MDDTALEPTQGLAVAELDSPPFSPAEVHPLTGATDVLAGRYELTSVVGRGGVGIVYLGHDLVLDRAVAVKAFRPDPAVPEEAVRYEQEARLLASLSHPGLVTVFDAGLDTTNDGEPRPFLVMELVRGQTVSAWCADGPVPRDMVAQVFAQVAAALAYVHRQGVVHRDVKPANVLLTRSDDGSEVIAKLTDFGIARLVNGSRLTVEGFTIGTPNYLSPEQVCGEAVGTPSDVYSLGLVLLECLTGQVAYPGHGIEAAVVRLQRPPSIPAWLGSEWQRLITSMIERDPTARPTAAQVAVALTGLAAAREPSPLVVPATAPGTEGSTSAAESAEPAALPQTTVLPAVSGGATRGADAGAGAVSPAGAGGSAAARLAQLARGRRWHWPAGAVALAVLAAVLLVAFAPGRDRVGGGPAVAVQYPAVSGRLGTDLVALQHSVATLPAGSDIISASFQADTMALTVSASKGAWQPAMANLASLRAHLAAAVAGGGLSTSQVAPVTGAADRVEADLRALIAPSSSAKPTPKATPAPARTTQAPVVHVAPVPKPQPKPPHRRHGDGGRAG